MAVLLPNSATYSPAEVETAICLWDELDRRTQPLERLNNLALFHWRAEHGTAELRTAAVRLVPYVDGVCQFLQADEWDGLAFDWEIIPAILDTLVWTSSGPTPTLPLKRESAITILRQLRAEQKS